MSRYRRRLHTRRPDRGDPPILPEDKPGRGLAGNLVRLFIDSPLTPLFMLSTLCIGQLGLFSTPRQDDPDISVPMIDLLVRDPRASTTIT